MNFDIPIGRHRLRPGGRKLLLAGPCVIESESHALMMAERIKAITQRHEDAFIWVFKASFDKANRSSIDSPRGVGIDEGLRILARIKSEHDVPIVTDIHLPHQAVAIGEVVDVIQIPAFLCRQTDLLVATAKTGRVVNIKKGQFLAPHDMGNPVNKVLACGNPYALITERGTSFGYNNLVVDYAGIPVMRQLGVPVIFDATHSTQLPGGLGATTGGRREMAPYLARAAAAVGIDGFFMEVHDNPEAALSDASNQLTLPMFEAILPVLNRVAAAANS